MKCFSLFLDPQGGAAPSTGHQTSVVIFLFFFFFWQRPSGISVSYKCLKMFGCHFISLFMALIWKLEKRIMCKRILTNPFSKFHKSENFQLLNIYEFLLSICLHSKTSLKLVLKRYIGEMDAKICHFKTSQKTQVSHLTHLSHSGSVHGQSDSTHVKNESFCPRSDPLWLKWVKWLIWAFLWLAYVPNISYNVPKSTCIYRFR